MNEFSRDMKQEIVAEMPKDAEKDSSIEDTHISPASTHELHATEDRSDLPSTLARWLIVIALLLGEFLVSANQNDFTFSLPLD